MGDEKKQPALAYGERSLEAVTPLGEPEWDPYFHRKHGVGLQPIVGVLRNDRTPLNTPYTPQLVKLHLKRHEDFEQLDEFDERPGKQLVSSIKVKVLRLMQPVHRIRAAVDKLLTVLVPTFVQELTLFRKVRPWVAWYLTAVVCVPFVMLVSPMLIAFSICTSPIWLAGIVVLVVRLLVRSPPLDEYSAGPEEEEETSPHHPNSVYRRAQLTTNHGQRGYG